MRVGVPREIKDNEFRVGVTPAAVAELRAHGHDVVVESGAGVGAGLTDGDYLDAGADLVSDSGSIWSSCELIIKVKEPLASERNLLRPGQILFTFLHLAADAPQARELVASGAICIAYETVTGPNGGLPLLKPMSEVAGRLAPQVGAHALERAQGGRGILLGGVPGVPPAEVVILGGGVSGTHAATIAIGMGAKVTVVDRSAEAMERLTTRFGAAVTTVFSTRLAISDLVRRADLLIGAVLIPGAAAPKLVSEDLVKAMRPGSVIVDVAIDQGGCIATSHATTHADPTFVLHGVVHYCVANMPGAVARTSTLALANVTLPFALALADRGWQAALRADPHLKAGLNVCKGRVTCAPVAEALGYDAVDADAMLVG